MARLARINLPDIPYHVTQKMWSGLAIRHESWGQVLHAHKRLDGEESGKPALTLMLRSHHVMAL